MEIIEKTTSELMPGDFLLNLGRIEKTKACQTSSKGQYYWISFENPRHNHGSPPSRRWYCMKNPPVTGRSQGDKVGAVNID